MSRLRHTRPGPGGPGPPALARAGDDPAIAATATAVLAASGVDAGEVVRCDTHLSVVFLAGDRAYKVKRELVLPFVDHRTAAARHRSCASEVRRNAALAPDVYLGVRTVVPTEAGGYVLADEADPAAVEYVVVMRRFHRQATLAGRLAAGDVADGDIDRLAALLAEYHRGARAVPAPHLPAPAAARAALTVGTNVDELSAELEDERDRAVLERVHRRLRAFVRAEGDLLARRGREGWFRELHGDLRAEHVVLDPDAVRIVDAIEFSAALREVDVADELAFLAMDLEALVAPSVADRLTERYVAHGGEPGPASLRAFYGAHRALVRAKVALLRPHEQDATLAEARTLIALAERLASRVRGPQALIVCGLSGSGKSHLASLHAGRTGATVVSTDVVRKAHAGLHPTTRGTAALYDPVRTLATYEDVGRRAADILRAGDSVIIDATCLHKGERAALVNGLDAWRGDATYVSCWAPEAVLRQRVQDRLNDPDRVSDATPEVLDRQLATAEPFDEVPPEQHLVLRTDGCAEHALDLLAAALDA